MKLKKSKYDLIVDEMNKREKERTEKIKHIESEIDKATEAYKLACDEYKKYENYVDADNMIQAGIKRDQTEKVLTILKDSMQKAKSEHIFSDNESDEYIETLRNEFNEFNEKTIKEIVELLKKIDKLQELYLNRRNEYQALMQKVVRKGKYLEDIAIHPMIINLGREITHEHDFFKEYFE